MSALSSATLLLQLIALGLLSYAALLLRRTRKHLRLLLSHQIAAQSAIQKTRLDMLELRNRTRLLEGAVTSGATAVEKVHKAITNTTFGLIDLFSKDEEFKSSARQVKTSHDETSQSFYQTVRTTNRTLRSLADVIIVNKVEKKIASEKDSKPTSPGPIRSKD
ncbi:hypothetical protein LPB19_11575 [Marinobacter salinisoli]|uniref:DUF2802 domain-containing protein n=1 Tax=Marinobacter salinisoli TaxID=2769486 RepID=A0ABX7MRW4_9GAMM|nr:hypothetical protein [Marinobacter salinisoli]QSP93836.1 hypothetical protein LPB19_11575 [Marinobacter salinisoli]